jgi:hypothetical protein
VAERMILHLLNLWGEVAFRLARGFWCDHADRTEWIMIDLGREKVRFCNDCGWMWSTR